MKWNRVELSGEIVDGPHYREDAAGWFTLDFTEARIRVYVIGPAVDELRKFHTSGRVKVLGSLIRNGRNDSLEILGRRLENPDYMPPRDVADEKARLNFRKEAKVLLRRH